MKKFARMAALAAAATIVATPAAAQVAVSNGPVTATARITKPLTLSRVADFDIGTIVVTGTDTVSMDQAGDITCGAVANQTCDPTGTPARYHVTGSNNNVVNIDASTNVSLSNGTDTLTLVLDAPASVTLPNSGASGVDFFVGGSINIPETTSEGVYTGDLDITVQY